MKLALRDRLAEICLVGLTDPAAEATIRALARFARLADPASGGAESIVDPERLLLVGESPFETAGEGIRLRPQFLPDLTALRWRAERFERAAQAVRSRCGTPACSGSSTEPFAKPRIDDLGWALCAAQALFNLELFFEVHELLEPYWRWAEGDVRPFLQGLIQVAVGLSHRANGNLRGARALLGDGSAKLGRFAPRAHGVELEDFLREVAEVAEHLGEPGIAVTLPKLTLDRSQDSAITR